MLSKLHFSKCFYALILISVLIGFSSAGTALYAQSNPAPTPTQSRLPDTWTAGNKLGMGTAYTYDQPAESNSSTVWFAITGGAITDVAYPTIDQANVKALALIVSDGKTFAIRDDDSTQTSVGIERLDGRSPAYKITVTASDGKWQTVKEILTDPQSNTLVLRVHLIVRQGQASDYQLYALYQPHLAQSGRDDESRIDQNKIIVTDQIKHVSSVLSASPAPLHTTVGYANSSTDFTQQLSKTYKLNGYNDQTDSDNGYVMAGCNSAPISLLRWLLAWEQRKTQPTPLRWPR